MGRPRGSKNIKRMSYTTLIQLNKYIKNTPIINDEQPYDFVSWGKRNDFPNMLMDFYVNSPIHSACVDFLVNGIVGGGVDYEKMEMSDSELVPNCYENWNTVIERLAFDLVVFGGFAIQIIKNRNDKTYSFFHQPFNTIRFGKKNEDGEVKKVYLCKEWKEWSKYGIVEVEHLNTVDDLNLQSGKPYIITYTRYNPIDPYYPFIPYTSIFNAIQADIKMNQFDLKCIQNNFTPSGCLVLNQVEDEQERRNVIKNVQDMFTDSENASNLMITFKNGNEDNPISYIPFESNVDGVNMFADNNDRTVNRIVLGHKIASKILIGLSLDGNGFNSEADYLESAFELTDKLVLSNLRKQLIGSLNTLFKLNGIEQELYLLPMTFKTRTIEKEANVVDEVVNPYNEDTQIS